MTHAEKIDRLEDLMRDSIVIEFHTLAAEIDAFERETYPIPPPTIHEAMMFRRDQMQETQREISLRAGMSLNRWKLLERGAVEPSIADARKLYAVGIPACVLLGMTENTLPLGVERMSEAQCSLFFVFGGNSRMNAGLSHGDESATPQAR